MATVEMLFCSNSLACALERLVLLIWMAFFMAQMVLANTALTSTSRNNSAVVLSGVLGRSALLPCNISAGLTATDRVVLILWYRSGIETPIYSVDGRDTEITKGGHWSSDPVLGRRATFVWQREVQKQQTTTGLLLNNLGIDDEGIYRCRIDYKEAQTRNLLVNLTVIVPPSAPVIYNEMGVRIPSVAGPYLEGQTLKLTCESSTGRPAANVVWFRNGEPWDSSYEVNSNGSSRNEMTLSRLRRTDVNTILSCEASNNDETIPASSFVLVDLLLAPLDVRLLGAESFLPAYHPVKVTCQSTGSRPPPMVTWHIDNQRLAGSTQIISHDGNVTTSVLSYIPTAEDQGKELKCRVENLKLPVSPLEASITFDLKFPPQVRIQIANNLAADNITEGMDVAMQCAVQARPPLHKIEWKLNGEKLVSNSTLGISVKGNNLLIRRVTTARSGNYSCEAWNSIGRNSSQALRIDIFSLPVCNGSVASIMSTRYIAIGESSLIHCNVTSHPEPTLFQWTLRRGGHARPLDFNRSSIDYSVQSIADYGAIQCLARNPGGWQQSPCSMFIKPPGPPEAPSNCTVHNTSTNSVEILCLPGSSHGLDQRFNLVVLASKPLVTVYNVTSVDPKFVVVNLEPGKEYVASLHSFNAKGKSLFNNFTLHTIDEPMGQPTIAESGNESQLLSLLTPTVSTVIAVSASFLSLLLVVAGVICRLKCRPPPRASARPPGSEDNFEMANSRRKHLDDEPLMTAVSSSSMIASARSRLSLNQCSV